MKPFELKKIDLSKYEVLRQIEPVGGSRPRLLLKNKINNQKYLLKTYSHNAYEIWSELLASRLGLLLDLNIQQVSIKSVSELGESFFPKGVPSDWVPVAALVRYAFPNDFDITYGNNEPLMGDESPRFTLSEIEQKIRSFDYDPGPLLQSFTDMVVFDTWIGNMDRHHGNWGILTPRRSQQRLLHPKMRVDVEKPRFAPLFDHGSTLIFELPEQKIQQFQLDMPGFKDRYILGKNYSFFLDSDGNKRNIFNLLGQIMKSDKSWNKRFKKAIKKFEFLKEIEIAKILLQMPRHPSVAFTNDRRNLLLFSLSERKHLLLKLLH